MYISQNEIGSKVHSPNSPSTSKEVQAGTQAYRTMQSMIPFFAALSLVSATRLSLLPYAYLSAPFPVTHQFQDTRTGVHAYSYAGGPSAKEEFKDADGVLRGSYSYVDPNGILQSVFYVADENGFRVAATNLPTDDNLQPEETHILLARSADSKSGRKKRSTQESPENPGQKDVKNSEQGSESTQELSTTQSYQENESQGKIEGIVTSSLLQPTILSGDIPLATSHQSQVQVHSSKRIQLLDDEDTEKPVELILPAPAIYDNLPSYHENRVELHKQLGIEGSKTRDAVKIDPEPITVVPSSSVAVPLTSPLIAKAGVQVLPLIANQAVPVVPTAQLGTSSVTTSISSHGVSQIHGPSRAAIAVPNLVAEPVAATKDAPVAGSVTAEFLPVTPVSKAATSTFTTSISSHGVSQIHGNSRIGPAILVRATPIAQLHSLVNWPIYLR